MHPIGLSWFRERDYPRILEIMDDPDSLPPTFERWKLAAEKLEAWSKAKDYVVIRAIIDPGEFGAWCASQGLQLDGTARSLFATEFAERVAKAVPINN